MTHSNSVRPELVEGFLFSFLAPKEGGGFDRLSPNGIWRMGIGAR